MTEMFNQTLMKACSSSFVAYTVDGREEEVGAPLAFTACCFGDHFGGYGNTNWTLGRFYQDTYEEDDCLLRQITHVTDIFRSGRVFAPSPALFNAKICSQKDMRGKAPIPLLNGKSVHRNKDCPADGTYLNPGEMGIISAGGCPLIVATCKNRLIFAHAGRDSLIDRKLIQSGVPGRERESVVDSIVEQFAEDIDFWSIHVYVYFALNPWVLSHPLNSPEYGTFNQKMFDYVGKKWKEGCATIEEGAVHLDLPLLIRRQFEQQGLPPLNIHTNFDRIDESPHFHHTRAELKNHRNLLVVARHT